MFFTLKPFSILRPTQVEVLTLALSSEDYRTLETELLFNFPIRAYHSYPAHFVIYLSTQFTDCLLTP